MFSYSDLSDIIKHQYKMTHKGERDGNHTHSSSQQDTYQDSQNNNCSAFQQGGSDGHSINIHSGISNGNDAQQRIVA